jgi:Flp pilus assembly protein TadD
VHPLQSEVVDYVTQRTESTMGFFYFLTLYCAIRGRRSNAHERRWDIAAVLSCLLGMASKETMVTAPLVVAAYDRVFEFGSWRETVRARARLYAGLAATWAGLGLLMWQAARSTVGASATVGPWTYLLNQCQVLTAYLGLLVWPRALVLDYGLPRVLSFGDIAVQALLIGVLVATALVAWTRWPKVGFLAGTFFLTIAPSSSVLPVLTEVGAERRMYLPSAALTVLAVVAGWWVLQRLAERYPRRAHVLVVGAGAVVCCAAAGLAARTMLRNREYASPVTLWRTVVDRRPHGRAHYGLGTALVDAERHDEAIAELRRAATDFPNARFALGTELFASGQYEEAVSTLRTFIRDQPERPERIPAQLLLGHALMGEGQLNDAAREFQALLDANPSNVGARDGLRAVGFAHRDLAATLVRQQRADAAVAHAREAVRLLPTDAATRNLLGAALASSGRVDEGVAQFQQALALDPTSQQTRNNLAHALALVRATGRQR